MKLPDWLMRILLYPLCWRYVVMPGRSYAGAFSALTNGEAALAHSLEGHVRYLAETIGERSIAKPAGLLAAEQYIFQEFVKLGYEARLQAFTFAGIEMKNVIIEKLGATKPSEVIVIGAHYDTVIGTPGADDNATGVAALLEMARWLKQFQPERTIRLVAFANEEHPGGPWDSMGSCVYANSCQQAGDDIKGMLSLEMLGVYSSQPNTQMYPRPFNLFYPTVANFIGFVGNSASRNLVRTCVKTFRQLVKFPCEGVAAPDSVKDIARSDHWAFWQIGVPALMVTDTSNFRYPLYHTQQDSVDKLDFPSFARVVNGLYSVVKDISS